MPDAEGDRAVGVLELRECVLEASDRRVPQALVDEAAAVGPAALREFVVRRSAGVDVGERIGGGQVDRGDVDAESGQVVAAGVYCTGVEHGGLLHLWITEATVESSAD